MRTPLLLLLLATLLLFSACTEGEPSSQHLIEEDMWDGSSDTSDARDTAHRSEVGLSDTRPPRPDGAQNNPPVIDDFTAPPPLSWCEGEACVDPEALVPAECGNGELEIGEYCDDGLPPQESACAPDCTPKAPFDSVDEHMEAMLEAWNIPGASLAVTYQGRLVLVRNYGYADIRSGERVSPQSRFRLASTSKTITVAVVMKLVEDGLLDLDASAFSYLDAIPALPDATEDPRLYDITLRQLLNFSAGWDRTISGDPLFGSKVATTLGIEPPVSTRQIITYLRGRPLDFTPGERFAFYNFNYTLLGVIVEEVTGMTYEAYTQQLLAPLGIDSFAIGRTRFDERLSNEVRYYGYPGEPLGSSVFPDVTGSVPLEYGAFYLEGFGATGAWVGTSIDVARLLVAMDGKPLHPDILSAESLETITRRPDLPEWENTKAWYSMGMQITPTPLGDDADWWNIGSLAGSVALFVRSRDDFTWVVLVNSRPADALGFFKDLEQTTWRAIRTLKEIPTYDLFDDY